MDLSGGFRKKGKDNIFAEIIERRQHEGDFLGLWRIRSKVEPGSTSWASRCMHIAMMLLGAGMLFALVAIPWLLPGKSRPEASFLPRAPGITAPAVKPVPPMNQKMKEALDRLKKEGAVAGTAGAVQPGETGEPPLPEEAPQPPEAPPPAPKPKPEPKPPAAEGPEASTARGPRPFRPPEPEFKQLAALDREVLDRAWDDIQYPEMGNDIKGEADVVAHVYRFLRTHGPDLASRADPNLTHSDMMRDPEANRGKVVSIRVQLVKKFNVQGWPRNDSGVLDTAMLFCYEATPRRSRGIYVVLVAEPLENFREEDLYDLTGVFLKRYAYINSSNVWQWQPLILTMKMTPSQLPETTSQNVTMAIVILAAVGVIALLFLVRGETREGQEKRAVRIERRRAAREHLKLQLGSGAEAGAAKPPASPQSAGPAADAPADPKGPGEKPPGSS